jgi:hypothetical protein
MLALALVVLLIARADGGAVCGDRFVDPPEQCDPPDVAKGCLNTCWHDPCYQVDCYDGQCINGLCDCPEGHSGEFCEVDEVEFAETECMSWKTSILGLGMLCSVVGVCFSVGRAFEESVAEALVGCLCCALLFFGLGALNTWIISPVVAQVVFVAVTAFAVKWLIIRSILLPLVETFVIV